MKSSIFLCFVLCDFIIAWDNIINSKNELDYYWVDYYGVTVQNAVLLSNSTYIGQTFYPNENVLLPSTMKSNNAWAYSVYAEKTLNSTDNTKMLYDPKSALEWIHVSTETIKQVRSNCVFVPGGYANSQNLFIGRDKNFNLGPVYADCKNGFHLIVYNGSKIIHINQFYILGRCLN